MFNSLKRFVRTPQRSQDAVPPAPQEDDVLEMLGVLGVAGVLSTMPTCDVEESLVGIARAHQREGIQVFALPTLVIVEDTAVSPERVKIFPVTGDGFRLDQAGGVEQVFAVALAATESPAEVVSRVTAIRASLPRFSPMVTVFGHTLLTIGFGLVLNPAPTAIPLYIVLGLLVGGLLLVGRVLPTLRFALPVIIPFIATGAVVLLLHDAGPTEIVRVVAPALMSFLPGLTLTIALIEMTRGQVVAGASRLSYGVAQLGLLAFGVFSAFIVFGGLSRPESQIPGVGWWVAWLGVLLVGVGYFFFSNAPPKSLPWILYAVFVAYAAQTLGNIVVGSSLSSAVGAVVVVPAVYLVARFPSAPSPAVMLTCAYWLMVPGALGFLGMSELANASGGESQTLLKTALSLVALAIGIVIGLGFSHDASKLVRRANPVLQRIPHTLLRTVPSKKSVQPHSQQHGDHHNGHNSR